MQNDYRLANSFILYIATLLFFAVGAITTLGLDWYATLAVPSWSPPNLLVMVIWCALFLLAGFSVRTLWDTLPHDKSFNTTLGLYRANAFLILLWNYLFFGLHALLAAFVVGVLVGLCVLALIVRTWRICPRAARLLLPYLLWIIFATYLSYLIWMLN